MKKLVLLAVLAIGISMASQAQVVVSVRPVVVRPIVPAVIVRPAPVWPLRPAVVIRPAPVVVVRRWW